jgi:hypothetical protein
MSIHRFASPFDVHRNSVDRVRASELAEFQGLYGPFLFPERISTEDLAAPRLLVRGGSADVTGRSLVDRRPWVRGTDLGGPDFKRARLVVGGRRIVGDVEIHLHEASWAAHAHASDPGLSRGGAACGAISHGCVPSTDGGGRDVAYPILILLPLLRRGLEDYADEDAIERLASRAAVRAVDEFALLPLAQRLKRLSAEAERRWSGESEIR